MIDQKLALKRAASYVSMFSNNDESCPHFIEGWEQLDTIYEAATGLGYKIVEEFGDLGASNAIDTRPSFKKMIATARSENCEFEAILVTSIDRFSPIAAEQVIIRSQLEAYGITLVITGVRHGY